MIKGKILLVDDDEQFVNTCNKILTENNLEVLRCGNDSSKIISMILNHDPMFVVMDMFQVGMDSIGIMKCINSSSLQRKPLFIIISSVEAESVRRELNAAGAFYFFYKPVDPLVLCERLIDFSNISYEHPNVLTKRNNPLETTVTEIMRDVGIPASIKGYYYIREAILISVENTEYLHSVTKMLYPEIAKRFDTTASKVERAIRHSIDVACNRGNIDVIRSYFGNILRNKSKPTNSEFIALFTDYLRIKNQNPRSFHKGF